MSMMPMDPGALDFLLGGLSGGGAPTSLLPGAASSGMPDFMKMLMGGGGQGPGIGSLLSGLMGPGAKGAPAAPMQMAGVSKGPTGMLPGGPTGAGPLALSQAIRRF